MGYPDGYNPGELRDMGVRAFEPWDYDAQSPGDRELMGIMTLTSICAFMFAASTYNHISSAIAVRMDIANVAGGTLSAEVRAGVLAALEARPLTTAERITLIGGNLTAEERAIVQAGMLADLSTMEGKIAYAAAEQYIAQQNFMNVIRLAETDALAGSRYLEGLGAVPIFSAPDRDIYGNIGAYFWFGPGGIGFHGGYLGGDPTSPGFPGFPGHGYVVYDRYSGWVCVGGDELNPPICHWSP